MRIFIWPLFHMLFFSDAFARGQSNQYFDDLEKSYNAEDYRSLIELTANHRHYFSGLYFVQNALAKGDLPEGIEDDVEAIIHNTGHTGLLNLPDSVLIHYSRNSGAFVLGEQAFKRGERERAQQFFELIKTGHPLEAEAKLYLGRIALEKQERTRANNMFDQCYEAASKWYGEVPGKILKRHYQRLQDFCRANQARVLYEQEQFVEAEEIFSKIDKRHEIWPFLIMDRAWSSYQVKDYNRALGLLSTFKAPLAASYFDPEVEVLTAQSYFHLCLYQDALVVVDHFYSHYKPLIESMKAMVQDPAQLKEFLGSDLEDIEKKNSFLRHLLVKLVRGQNFKRLEKELLGLSQEMRRIDDWPASEMKDHFLAALKQMRDFREQEMMVQLQSAMVDLINRTNHYSQILFNLKLEILSRNRDLVYKGQSLISDRARGNYDKAVVRNYHNFYPVHGEFWADEFGDYNFGLENNCEVVKTETWEEPKDTEEQSAQDGPVAEDENAKAQAAKAEEQANVAAEEAAAEAEKAEQADQKHKRPNLEFPSQLQENNNGKVDMESTEFKELTRPGAVGP